MTKWIKSVHRSPDTERKILLYMKSGDMQFGHYRKEIKRFFYQMGGVAEPGQVIYWSEIPFKPK